MSELKFTPGPWTVEPNSLRVFADHAKSGEKLIAEPVGANADNARLIAAAPELILALRESYAVIAALTASRPHDELQDAATKAQAANDAALTKAGDL